MRGGGKERENEGREGGKEEEGEREREAERNREKQKQRETEGGGREEEGEEEKNGKEGKQDLERALIVEGRQKEKVSRCGGTSVIPAFRSQERGSRSLLSLRPAWGLSRATRRKRRKKRKNFRWWREK